MTNASILILFTFAWASCSHYEIANKQPPYIESEDIVHYKAPEQKPEINSKPSKKEEPLSLRYKEKHYQFWLKYFSGKNKKRFLRQLKNGDKYRDIVRSVFKKHDLPEDLFYVGLIESGFHTHARSHAAAVGPWQFIRGTGRRYHLRIDRHIDERRSIYKATEAAAQYFKDLYNIFGSWELALCAYNAGEYRIINAIRKGNTRDYKMLVKKKLIPKETIFYIPKIAVARYLDKKWKTPINQVKRNFYNEVDYLNINQTINVAKVAKNIGISWKNLKKLNPDLNSYWLRPRRRTFHLYIPTNKKLIAINYLKSLGYDVKKYLVKKTRWRKNKSAHHAKKTRKYYRVKRGENLHGIAKKLGTTVYRLKRKNRLRSSKILVGQRLKVPHRQTKRPSRNNYRVKRGDNLTTIARKLGTTVYRLKKKNRLRSGKIMTGQRLRIPASKERKYYVVKRGDNLTRIAQRFGVSIAHILRINQLKNEIIYPRQRIIIPSG